MTFSLLGLLTKICRLVTKIATSKRFGLSVDVAYYSSNAADCEVADDSWNNQDLLRWLCQEGNPIKITIPSP